LCGFFFYRLTTRRCAPEVAVWGLLVIVLSGCFILNAASYRPAVLSLLFLLLAVHCIDRYEGTAYPSWYGVLAGAFLALVSIVELEIGVVSLIAAFLMSFVRRFWLLPMLIIVGLAPFTLFQFLYNYAITGNAWIFVEQWTSMLTLPGTVATAAEQSGPSFLRFVYLTSPALAILYCVGLYKRFPDIGAWRVEEWLSVLLVIAYFADGKKSGTPDYLFAALPFVVLVVISGFRERTPGWMVALFLAGGLYSVTKVPLVIE